MMNGRPASRKVLITWLVTVKLSWRSAYNLQEDGELNIRKHLVLQPRWVDLALQNIGSVGSYRLICFNLVRGMSCRSGGAGSGKDRSVDVGHDQLAERKVDKRRQCDSEVSHNGREGKSFSGEGCFVRGMVDMVFPACKGMDGHGLVKSQKAGDQSQEENSRSERLHWGGKSVIAAWIEWRDIQHIGGEGQCTAG